MGSSKASGSAVEQILYAPKGVMSGLKTLAWWLFPRDPVTGAYLPPEQAPWFMPMQPYEGLLPGQQPIPEQYMHGLGTVGAMQDWLMGAGSPQAAMAPYMTGAVGALQQAGDITGQATDVVGRGMGFLEQAAQALFPIAQGALTSGLEQAAARYYESLQPRVETDIATALERAGLGGTRYSSGAQQAIGDVMEAFYSDYMKNLMQAAQTGAELQTRAALGTPQLGSAAGSLGGILGDIARAQAEQARAYADLAQLEALMNLQTAQTAGQLGKTEMAGAGELWSMTGKPIESAYQEHLRQAYYPMELMQTLVSALRPRKVKQQSSSSAKGGCCFIFLEAYDGHLPWVVRAYRDQHMTDQNRRGYYRLADKLVPLMRKSKVIKHLVRFLMTRPMTFYGRYFYKLNPWGVLGAPITAFWLLVFNWLGRKAPYIRSNGEVV